MVLVNMRVRSKPATIETEGETDTNWKCTSCGAENENFRQFCDGCGDPRPGVSLPSSGGISMDDLMAPKETEEQGPSFDTDTVETRGTVETRQDERAEPTSDTFEDKFGSQAKPEAEPEEISPPQRTPEKKKSSSRKMRQPETVLTGTFKASTPKNEESFPVSEPAASAPGQHFALVFVNSPASSIIKSRVSLEFDDFPIVTIGRSPENVVVVPDQEVSRRHAQLTVDGDRVLLKDLKSSNGTFLYNGKEFQRVGSDSVEVKPNSIIKFGTGTIVRLVTSE